MSRGQTADSTGSLDLLDTGGETVHIFGTETRVSPLVRGSRLRSGITHYVPDHTAPRES